MENLTKQQIVLLTLLVSFVTSLATGIVTVALMNQAPQGFIQTVNRVVEKVIPATITNTQTVVKETVVVSVDDMIVRAIDKNLANILRIYRTNTDPSAEQNSMVFVSLGFPVADDGIIVTDNSLISGDGKYFVTLSDGKLHNLSVLSSKQGNQVALLKIADYDPKILSLGEMSLSADSLKLGQTVIYMGGQKKNQVATGIVSSLNISDNNTVASSTATSTQSEAEISSFNSISTNIQSQDFISGAPLLNLSGDIVGFRATFMDTARTDLFVPSKAISDALASLAIEQKKAQ